MKRRGANPVTGSLLFLLLLLIWLVVGLTLLGPYVSAVFLSLVSYNAPIRSMGFACPLLADRETAIQATISNPDQQAHIFDVTFAASMSSYEFKTLCQSEVTIQPGDSQTATCTMNPVEAAGAVGNLLVTARVREESSCGLSTQPCVISSQWSCYIASFNENLANLFGDSLAGLALLGASRSLLRRVHRFVRPILLLLWLLVWLTFVLLATWLVPDYWSTIPFVIPSVVLLVGWLLRLYPRVAQMVARQP